MRFSFWGALRSIIGEIQRNGKTKDSYSFSKGEYLVGYYLFTIRFTTSQVVNQILRIYFLNFLMSTGWHRIQSALFLYQVYGIF